MNRAWSVIVVSLRHSLHEFAARQSLPGHGVDVCSRNHDAPQLKSINDELRRLGHDVHIESGDGYFYVWKAMQITGWAETINVPKVRNLTLSQGREAAQVLKVSLHYFYGQQTHSEERTDAASGTQQHDGLPTRTTRSYPGFAWWPGS